MAASLDRFIKAQNGETERVPYATARAELMAGSKRSCWIWYVFPQFKGDRVSARNDLYQLRTVAEAAQYLRHPELRQRLIDLVDIVRRTVLSGARLPVVLGGSIDAKKFLESMTTFLLTACGEADAEITTCIAAMLRACGRHDVDALMVTKWAELGGAPATVEAARQAVSAAGCEDARPSSTQPAALTAES